MGRGMPLQHCPVAPERGFWLLAKYREEVQVRKELQGLALQSDDFELMAARYQSFVQENENAKAGAIDKLNLRKVQNDILARLGKALDLRPHARDVRGIEVVVDIIFLRHCELYRYH
jgi:hypothetical protein